MDSNKWLRDAVVAQFGNEIKAGLHTEFPRLRQLWIEDEMGRAEQDALVQACFDVAGWGAPKPKN